MKINVDKFKQWLMHQSKHEPEYFYTDFFYGRLDALRDVYNAVSQGDRDFMEEGDE